MGSKQKLSELNKTKYVQTGEVEVGSKNDLLVSTPLGSCIAVIAFDAKTNIGGMAHVMLPDESHEKNPSHKNRYAIDAIDNLFSKLKQLGVSSDNIEICLAGGANVLRRKNETITLNVTNSVFKTINEKKLKILKTSLGGFERRIVSLNLKTGVVYCALGDGAEKILWKFV